MKHTFKISTLVLMTVLSATLVGCGGGQNETYRGVQPGIACEKAYSKPANVAHCKQEEGRH